MSAESCLAGNMVVCRRLSIIRLGITAADVDLGSIVQYLAIKVMILGPIGCGKDLNQ
ncbi:MAG: hypothetical protein L7R66_01485 [Candidatus Thalassarchaeaceae archaeon]|jgi:hypothetical protein|nr:hypothetical protein [Candidatus Thalassarchaeaceae archaeon]|tara:strand:- start:1778 stop:1948 length:171 start_codon:yes stop_codon:yes gene_type:complete